MKTYIIINKMYEQMAMNLALTIDILENNNRYEIYVDRVSIEY